MPRRAVVVERVAELVGHDVLRVTDSTTIWPALATLVVEGQAVDVALFVGTVGLGARPKRHGIERRFQNPGKGHPLVVDPTRRPLLLGLWEGDALATPARAVLVSADPLRREGLSTRHSIFVRLDMLQLAAETGWAEYANSAGETIRCFLPPLLPISADADWTKVPLTPQALQTVIDAAGLPEAMPVELADAVRRARRAGAAIVRDRRFSGRVADAYGGSCAMCGLDIQLVEGAHIYPAAAPGSPDEPWNGLALCANHHAAFDRHLIGVLPESREIVFHHDVLAQVDESPPVKAWVEGSFNVLAEPREPALRPRSEMFVRRYEHFAGLYDWLFGVD